MRDFLLDLSRNIRIADLFDIGILSFFAYSVIVWFRRTTSRLVVIGMVVLALIYFAARTFDLYLTSLLFQAFFAVLLVALVVVFQEEIRRGFERLAIWGTFRDRRRFAAMPGVDTLLEGISTMASERIGALIVIRGREPLDRHVEGGIPLYGRMSKPLLYSLFDPHSAGHDGAALIEGDRISKFGVHLPLSKNMAQIGTLGTRHAAGLGLSECSDAFVIIVSEERGTLRVAQDGRLISIDSIAELKSRLDRFYADHFRHEMESSWRGVFRQNARIKILSVVLALTAWFLFAYRTDNLQRTFVVPIEHRNIPEDWSVETREPREATVTLSGSSRAFGLLNPSSLILSLDLARLQEGEQKVPIGEDQLRKPANLQIYRINPAMITLRAYPMAMADLPVEAQTKNALPKGVRLAGFKVIPERVRVKLRQRQPEGTQSLLTEPIDLSEVTQTTLFQVGLLLPEGARLVEGTPASIRVTVEVAEQPPAAS